MNYDENNIYNRDFEYMNGRSGYMDSFQGNSVFPYNNMNSFNNTYTRNQTGFRNSNISNVQMKGEFFKSQYPEIYRDINKIITDILPNYRNVNITEKELDDMVEEVFKIRCGSETENTNASGRNKSENVQSNKTQHDSLLRDLIRILILTRLIKQNLDNINVNSGYYNPYPNFPEMRGNNMDAGYMGYIPRNYF